MEELKLALYAYHGCDFAAAGDQVERCPPSVEAAVLRVKCLCELDQASLGKAYADLAQRDFAGSGPLHYYRGMAAYLAGGAREVVAEAFTLAVRQGSACGHLGLAFLAYAAGDVAGALQALAGAATLDWELEHVRSLMRFQILLDAGRFAEAEQSLAASDQILKEQPSLLRSFWGQLCWVRLLQATRCFEVGHAAAARLVEQLSPSRTPRLYRNAKEVLEKIKARDDASSIHVPPAAALPAMARGAPAGTMGRKPMLHSLFHFLCSKGGAGATKEEIVGAVWEQAYNPLVHDDRLYKSIGRLRRLLGDDAQCPRLLFLRGSHYILDQESVPSSRTTALEKSP